MKITKLIPWLVKAPGTYWGEYFFVEVRTDEGLSGWGEITTTTKIANRAVAGIIRQLNDLLVGEDPSQIERLWHKTFRSFTYTGSRGATTNVVSGIDIALWDIRGKVLNQPIYELLGGKVRERVRLYANGWSFRASTPDEFAAATERPLRDGYTALKLYPLANPAAGNPHGMIRHVSQRSISREAVDLAVARVAAVRQAIGPEIELMVDMSGELTTDAIIQLGRRLEEFDLTWLEEPVDPFDPEGMREVATALRIPIAAGERLYTRYDFRRLLELRAAHILQPDVGNTGGLLEVKRIAAMAEAWNLRVAPHLCAGPIATAATLQLDATLTNFMIQEVYPYRVPEHFALVDRAPELEIKDGHLAIPDRAGFGVALDAKRIAPFLWNECSA